MLEEASTNFKLLSRVKFKINNPVTERRKLSHQSLKNDRPESSEHNVFLATFFFHAQETLVHARAGGWGALCCIPQQGGAGVYQHTKIEDMITFSSTR